MLSQNCTASWRGLTVKFVVCVMCSSAFLRTDLENKLRALIPMLSVISLSKNKTFFMSLTKDALFEAKSIRLSEILRKLFNALFISKFGRTFSMTLYSKLHWSTANYISNRILRFEVLVYMAQALVYEGEGLDLDPTFTLPVNMTLIINLPVFYGFSRESTAFDVACKAIGVHEGNFSMMATAFRIMIFVRVHMRETDWLYFTEWNRLENFLKHQVLRIISDVHCLAFL